jgi:hypothetical protein
MTAPDPNVHKVATVFVPCRVSPSLYPCWFTFDL